MRVVHSRKKVWDKDYAFEDGFTLLTWVLSLVKWKEYGFTTVLYTDNETLNKIKEYGFEYLYDEIDTEYLDENSKNINFWCFWAMPKILSYKAEIEKGHTDSIVADTDIVPMRDLHDIFNLKMYDLVVWSNKEHAELQAVYPKLENLSLPKDYKLPLWFKGDAKPLNTGIIYFKDSQKALGYLNEVIKISKNNDNHKHNTRTQTMCTAEQRMIGEYAKAKGLVYNVIQPVNETLFNKNAFHAHGYKSRLSKTKKIQFNVNLLNMLPSNLYNRLINKELFYEELIKINGSSSPIEKVKELQNY